MYNSKNTMKGEQISYQRQSQTAIARHLVVSVAHSVPVNQAASVPETENHRKVVASDMVVDLP